MIHATQRLRTLAAHMVSERTMERVIDPLLTDAQLEYEAARRQGRRWRSRWTLIAGGLTFLKTLTLCVAHRVVVGDRVRTMDDGAALKRTAWISFAAMLLATAWLMYPPLARQMRQRGIVLQHPEILLTLVPQALSLAIPIGVTFGVLIGMRGRTISTRVWWSVAAYAVACSLAGLATLVWLRPAANQAFREVAFEAGFNVSRAERPLIEKGLTELTLGELRQRMAMARSDGSGSSTDVRFALFYHQIWALSFASLVLALFGLSFSRQLASRWTSVLFSIGTIVCYYVLLWVGQATSLRHVIPAGSGAWLPNLVFAIVAAAVFISKSRSREMSSANGREA